jgi:hypothetical protein
MSAESLTETPKPMSGLQGFANLAGGALKEVGRDPGFLAHASHVGAEGLLAAGVIREDSRGRKLPSLHGIADAFRDPRGAVSAAAESVVPHVPELAFRAGAIIVNHVVGKMTGHGNETPRAAIQA